MAGWTSGMALLAAFAATPMQDTGWNDAPRIEVALANFKFLPATITLHHGQRYVLHLANQASGGHDFAAPEFFAAATVSPEDSGKIAKGRVALGAGESVDLHLTAPTSPGRYILRCTHFMHAAFGMKGSIVVD